MTMLIIITINLFIICLLINFKQINLLKLESLFIFIYLLLIINSFPYFYIPTIIHLHYLVI
jgi:hypothetical protein